MKISLMTSYLGLQLKHPFILGASPLTGDLDSVQRVADGGCAAIVMHSLFEETIRTCQPRRLTALRA